MSDFPRWKYALVAIVLLFGIVYALPNAFPPVPAVQVQASHGAVLDATVQQKVADALKKQNIAYTDLAIDGDGHVFLGEMAWNTDETHMDGRPFAETKSAQMSVRDLEGNLLTRWGGDDPCSAGSFASPHGLCLDSRGSLYARWGDWFAAGCGGMLLLSLAVIGLQRRRGEVL